MSAVVHDFARSLALGEAHEALLDSAFESRGWKVIPATDTEQRDGVDRWLSKEDEGGARWSVEYKADLRSEETGNYALELLSSIPDNDGPVRTGWALRAGADWLVFFKPVESVAFIVRAWMLRAAVRRWLTTRVGRIAPVRNTSWTSLVLLVPCGSVETLAVQRMGVSR